MISSFREDLESLGETTAPTHRINEKKISVIQQEIGSKSKILEAEIGSLSVWDAFEEFLDKF